MNNILRGIALILILPFANCTPAPVYRLVPESEKITWVYGQAYVSQIRPDAQVAMAFREQQGESLLFDIEIKNTSRQTFLFDPSEVAYLITEVHSNNGIDREAKGMMISAADPEHALLEIDLDQSREDADHQTTQTLNVISTVLDVVAAVSDNDASQDTQLSNNFNVADDIDDIVYESDRHDYAQMMLADERGFWADYVLRKTHLPAGETLHGLVLIPLTDGELDIRMMIPAGGETFHFGLKQKAYQP